MRAIACALGALVACAQSGEELPVAVRSDEPEPVCGALAIETTGEWRTDHPLFAPLAAGWHPRAENGWAIAVRDAVAPWTFPNHEFVQVKVGGIPRDREWCWVPTGPEQEPSRRECAVLWQLIHDNPPETWPRTAREWALVVAATDGASAVFVTPEELAQCGATPQLYDWKPGLRGTQQEPQLTFVERFDNARSTTWLRVEIGQKNGRFDIERTEILTTRHPASTVSAPEPVPPWDGVWPKSDEPIRAILGVREPRIHPLWRTPIDDACPAAMFASLSPDFIRGDTYSRVHTRLSSIEDRRLGITPSEVMPVHDHIELPGVMLVAAMDSESSCMMGWAHTHCLVADDAVWCPDGTTKDLQQIVDRFALKPFSLSDAQWFELAVVMSGVSTFVIEPGLLSECTHVEGARADAPRVVRGWNSVTIEFTAIEDGHGRDVRVEIADGRASMTAKSAWTAPPRE
jgi:hypothetical protein